MGMWNFIVDMGQAAELAKHEETIDILKTKVVILEQWVVYLNKRLDMIQSNQSNTEQQHEDNHSGQS